MLLGATAARAQESEVDPLEAVRALEARIAQLEEARSDEVDELRAQIEELRYELAHPPTAGPDPQNPNIFNPEITVNGSFLKRSDSQAASANDFLDNGGTARVDDQFILREVEVDLRAAISPWSNGVLTVSFESVSDDEFLVGIEEGYVNFKRLPLVTNPPGGLKLKAGRFRADFGRLNKVHQHDLPQPDHPRALETFLGDHGYIGTGLSGQFFLPSPSESSALQCSLEYVNGGGLPAAVNASARDATGVGRLSWFQELSDSHTLDVGFSTWSDGSDHTVFGADLAYEWQPPAQGTWRSLLVGTEFFLGDFDDPALSDDPMGYYAYAQYQFDSATYAGITYDYAEEIADESLTTTTSGVFVTRYTAEFLRFRLGFEHTESDITSLDGLDTLFLELAFIFGAHPIEPYWVNR